MRILLTIQPTIIISSFLLSQIGNAVLEQPIPLITWVVVFGVIWLFLTGAWTLLLWNWPSTALSLREAGFELHNTVAALYIFLGVMLLLLVFSTGLLVAIVGLPLVALVVFGLPTLLALAITLALQYTNIITTTEGRVIAFITLLLIFTIKFNAPKLQEWWKRRKQEEREYDVISRNAVHTIKLKSKPTAVGSSRNYLAIGMENGETIILRKRPEMFIYRHTLKTIKLNVRHISINDSFLVVTYNEGVRHLWEVGGIYRGSLFINDSKVELQETCRSSEISHITWEGKKLIAFHEEGVASLDLGAISGRVVLKWRSVIGEGEDVKLAGQFNGQLAYITTGENYRYRLNLWGKGQARPLDLGVFTGIAQCRLHEEGEHLLVVIGKKLFVINTYPELRINYERELEEDVERVFEVGNGKLHYLSKKQSLHSLDIENGASTTYFIPEKMSLLGITDELIFIGYKKKLQIYQYRDLEMFQGEGLELD